MPRGRPRGRRRQARGRGRQGRGDLPSHAEPSSSDQNSSHSNSSSGEEEQPPVPMAHPNQPGVEPLVDPAEQPPVPVAHPNQPGVGPLVNPAQPPLLRLQADHRSQAILNGVSLPALTARHHVMKLEWNPKYKPYLIRAGLYGVHQIGHVPADARLITALVERWRQETHTFHLPVGEATITLEDVAILFGLPIDGRPLVGRTDLNWSVVVQNLLGRPVTATTFKGRNRTKMRLGWLDENFHSLPEGADDITVQYYARAYMLALVGSVLFTDHSGDCLSILYLPFFEDFDECGKYSWGSAVLAYLYRELCLATSRDRKQIGGPLLLLQIWSWERFPFGRPQPRNEEPQLGGDELESRPSYGFKWSGLHEFAEHVTCRLTGGYRDDCDRLTDDGKVNWRPYEEQLHLLPPICTSNLELRMSTAPLIHFWIVEMYNPERVMRQFGLYQSIPPFLRDTNMGLHKMKHANCRSWRQRLAPYLVQWEHRWDNLVQENRPYDPTTFEDYKRWLFSVSILRLQTSQMRSANQPWIHPRLLQYQQIVPDLQSAAEKIWELTRSAAQLLGAWDEAGAKTFVRSVLSTGKIALEDLGQFTAIDGTFNALNEDHEAENEEHQVENEMEDVPEDSGGSSGSSNGSREHQVEMDQDEPENRPMPVPNGNVRMQSDEAGPSRPPPKRGRLYSGG